MRYTGKDKTEMEKAKMKLQPEKAVMKQESILLLKVILARLPMCCLHHWSLHSRLYQAML
jgi:hypothetical protein